MPEVGGPYGHPKPPVFPKGNFLNKRAQLIHTTSTAVQGDVRFLVYVVMRTSSGSDEKTTQSSRKAAGPKIWAGFIGGGNKNEELQLPRLVRET